MFGEWGAASPIIGIQAIYLDGDKGFINAPFYLNNVNLAGYWPFNGNANDASGNSNNGTLVSSRHS